MFWFLVLLVIVAVVAYKYRVPLIAKLTGQSHSRIDRQLNRRK